MTTKATNIVWHDGKVTPADRAAVTGTSGCVLWLTGLSGCGKSTIAMQLEHRLISQRRVAYVLDGDNLRHGLNGDLGFAATDRTENIRRAGEVAKLFSDAGLIVICSFISPFAADRAAVRSKLPAGKFIEIFVDAPLDVCSARDPKGLYKKARAAQAQGRPMQMTGLDQAYEIPEKPEIHLHTDKQSVQECVEAIESFLAGRNLFEALKNL